MSADADVLARLDELEREAAQRRAELDALILEIPAATSRRTLLKAAVSDITHAPNRGEIAWRGIRKLLRAPAALVRRLRQR